MSWTNTALAMSAAAVNALSKYTQKCSDCGSSDFVEDFSAGDLVCQVSVMSAVKQSCSRYQGIPHCSFQICRDVGSWQSPTPSMSAQSGGHLVTACVPRLCSPFNHLQHVPLRNSEKACLPPLEHGTARSATATPDHSDLRSLNC